MDMPSDVYMLLSLANTKLRDVYPSPQDMCADLGWDEDELFCRLSEAGYRYDGGRNAFVAG